MKYTIFVFLGLQLVAARNATVDIGKVVAKHNTQTAAIEGYVYEKPTIPFEEIRPKQREQQQNKATQQFISSANVSEILTEKIYPGYIYQKPSKVFESPLQSENPTEKPIDEYLSDILENLELDDFVHQDLGSLHKSNHTGSVQRIKLNQHPTNLTDIRPCANGKDLHTIMTERRKKRPQNRRKLDINGLKRVINISK